MADPALPQADRGELDALAEARGDLAPLRVVARLAASLLLIAWQQNGRFLTDADRSLIARLRGESFE